jgi:CHAT domain-containing protein/Tfp pilus assembly protein PilF
MTWRLTLVALAACACSDRGPAVIDRAIVRSEAAVRTGDLAEALRAVDNGLAHAGTDPASDRFWKLRLMRGEVLISRGELDAAVPTLEAALPADSSFAGLRARQQYLRARVQTVRGERPQALDTLDRARALTAGDPELAVDLDLLAGQIELQEGRFGEAEARLTGALARSARAGDRFRQLGALNNLGMGRLVRGHYDRALEWFDRGLAFSDLGETTLYAKALSNAGVCYSRLGLFDRAIAIQHRAVAIHERRSARVALLEALGSLGNTLILGGRPREALPHLERALDVAREAGLADETALWAGNLASAHIELANWDQAERYDQEARRLGESSTRVKRVYSVLNRARIAAGRGQLAEADALFTQALESDESGPAVRWSAQAGLAGTASAAGQRARAVRFFEEALRTVEQTRSDLLKTDYRLSFLTELITFYRDYVDALVAQGLDERALEIADSSRGRVLAERQRVEAPGRATAASFRRLSQRSGAVLLSYWLAPARSYLWVVASGRTRRIDLPSGPDIERAVSEYRQSVERTLADPLASPSPGDRLYEMLVRPAGVPRGASVVIVPDGALHGVNFETLPVDGPRRHYFIEDAAIQVAPSLALLDAAARSGAGRASQPAEAGVLLIGNPTPHPPDFPALSYAAAEMTGIVRRFAPGRVTAFEGGHASPATYRAQALDGFSMIHFTAHATANVESPLDSAVVLSGPDPDYKLYARDVADMPLAADLVTVSACRSAGERAYAGEGLVGFAWAFLRAGARRVIAGLWDVDDQSTARLMSVLYERLAANEPPAQALRAAKLALLEAGGRTARPYYWGPFQLYTAGLD